MECRPQSINFPKPSHPPLCLAPSFRVFDSTAAYVAGPMYARPVSQAKNVEGKSLPTTAHQAEHIKLMFNTLDAVWCRDKELARIPRPACWPPTQAPTHCPNKTHHDPLPSCTASLTACKLREIHAIGAVLPRYVLVSLFLERTEQLPRFSDSQLGRARLTMSALCSNTKLQRRSTGGNNRLLFGPSPATATLF